MKNTRTLSMLPTSPQLTGKNFYQPITPEYIRYFGIAFTEAYPHLLWKWTNY